MSLSKRKNFAYKLDLGDHYAFSKKKPNKNVYANLADLDEDNNLPLFVLEINERSEASARSKPRYSEPQKGAANDLTVGTLVEISQDVTEEPLYGVVRWLGVENGTDFVLVGVELENDTEDLPLELTDGTRNGDRLFDCPDKRALFVPIQRCHKDSRFQDGLPTPVHKPSDDPIDNVSII